VIIDGESPDFIAWRPTSSSSCTIEATQAILAPLLQIIDCGHDSLIMLASGKRIAGSIASDFVSCSADAALPWTAWQLLQLNRQTGKASAETHCY
jgi:hypothetical protein